VPWDVNQDGSCGWLDSILIAESPFYGQCDATAAASGFDVNGDGCVDQADQLDVSTWCGTGTDLTDGVFVLSDPSIVPGYVPSWTTIAVSSVQVYVDLSQLQLYCFLPLKSPSTLLIPQQLYCSQCTCSLCLFLHHVAS
jgi:hypothetical protein